MDFLKAQQKYLNLPFELQQKVHWNVTNHLEMNIEEHFPNDNIISIEEVDYSDDEDIYVYDIETEDGSFQAGTGCIILKNTDSIYTKFMLPDNHGLSQKDMLNKIAEVSEKCAERITKTFKPPIELEFEKIMYPILLFTKKRYAYLGWEPGKNGIEEKGIDIKGLQLIKREYCPYVKKIGMSVLNNILKERNVQASINTAKLMVQNLLQDRVPIEELIMSKQLKSSYKEVNKHGKKLTKPPHWYLAQKMLKRDPMNAPKGGDRISYVFIENKNYGALQMDRIEDPEYVKEHNLPIDSLYYLEKQISVPLYTIFSCIFKNKDGKDYEVIDNKIPKECKKQIDDIWSEALVLRRAYKKRQFFNKYFTNKN